MTILTDHTFLWLKKWGKKASLMINIVKLFKVTGENHVYGPEF